MLNVEDFLARGVENHRLQRYLYATSPEDAYPLHDRPRGRNDLQALNYLLNAKKPISPIVVVIFNDKKNALRRVKLDGAHRLMAACLSKSTIKVCWLDLTSFS